MQVFWKHVSQFETVSNSTGIGLRGTQMVDIRQPRGRLDLEVDKQ